MCCTCLQVAESCRAKGAASCDDESVDISQSEAVQKFAKNVLSKHKQVDVLVNNAGMGAPGKNSPLQGAISQSSLSLELHKVTSDLSITDFERVLKSSMKP